MFIVIFDAKNTEKNKIRRIIAFNVAKNAENN